jgi:hypothetical protein
MVVPKMHFIFLYRGPVRFKDMANDEFPIPAHEANKIMHCFTYWEKHLRMMSRKYE